jgi:hypothetical protein
MDIQDIAKEAFAVLGTGRQVAPFSGRHPDFGLEDAYRVTAAVRALRETCSERPMVQTGPFGRNTTSVRLCGDMSTTVRCMTCQKRAWTSLYATWRRQEAFRGEDASISPAALSGADGRIGQTPAFQRTTR